MYSLKWMLFFTVFSFSLQACGQRREVALNPEHRFEFLECEMRYNGQTFKLGDSIDKLVEMFGPYTRKVRLAHDTYVWDTLGVSVYVPWDEKHVIEMNIIFDSQQEMNTYPPGEEHDFRRKVQADIQASIPRPFFSGGIIVGGVAIDRQSTIEDYNQQAKEFRLSNGPMGWRYKTIFTNCEPSRLSYFIDVADDGKTIESFGVSDHTILDKD